MSDKQAFPTAGHQWSEMEWVPAPAQQGMTLRQYTAIKLMAAYMSDKDVSWSEKQIRAASQTVLEATEYFLEEMEIAEEG